MCSCGSFWPEEEEDPQMEQGLELGHAQPFQGNPPDPEAVPGAISLRILERELQDEGHGEDELRRARPAEAISDQKQRRCHRRRSPLLSEEERAQVCSEPEHPSLLPWEPGKRAPPLLLDSSEEQQKERQEQDEDSPPLQQGDLRVLLMMQNYSNPLCIFSFLSLSLYASCKMQAFFSMISLSWVYPVPGGFFP